MNPICYKLDNLKPIEFYKKHLEIVTVFLPGKITETEILVLASFMSLKGDIAKDMFGTSARKIIMQNLNMKPGGLGNHLKGLLNAKAIYKDTNGKYQINKWLIPDNNKYQNYQFKIVSDE